MRLHDAEHVVQPQPEARCTSAPAPACRRGTLVFLEYLRLVLQRNAKAVVAHRDRDASVGTFRRSEGYLHLTARIFHGIVYQVAQCLAQKLLVGIHRRSVQLPHVAYRLLRLRLILCGKVLQHRAQQAFRLVEPQLAVLQFGERQHLVGQADEVLALLAQDAEILRPLLGLAVEPSGLEDARAHHDGAERRLHVVYHRVREVLAQLRHLVLPQDDAHLPHHAHHRHGDNQHRGYQHQRHAPRDDPVGVGDDALHEACLIEVEHQRVGLQDALPMQLFPHGRTEHPPRGVGDARSHLGTDTGGVEHVGVNRIEHGERHVLVYFRINIILQAGMDARHQPPVRHVPEDGSGGVHLEFHRQRGVFAEFPLLVYRHPVERLFQRSIAEHLVRLHPQAFPRQPVAVRQPHVLQLRYRQQGDEGYPA